MMRKDFAKRKFSAKNNSPLRWVWVLFASVFTIFFLMLGYFIFQYKQATLTIPFISAYFSHVEDWLATRKNHLQKGLASNPPPTAKPLSNKPQAPAPVHFEFYTALPNMQVMLSDPVVEPKINMDAMSTSKKAPPGRSIVVVSPDELERELANQIQQNAFVVQCGLFRTAAAADRYFKTMVAAGFDPTIVTLHVGEKETYRVQLGPFLTKVQAKSAQRQLQEQGIDGIVLKMNTA